ncbi:MAG: hypothetical protein FWD36_03980 [Treponema sp.]|nr:hypothetical protein [Treponema sp.]
MFILCGIALLLCLGCTTVVEKTGQALDGSAFAEKNIATYQTPDPQGKKKVPAEMEIREMRNKAGEHSVLITLHTFPAMRIRGSAPDSRGEFQLTSLDYLGGNHHGWNEYRLDLFGSGNLVLGETTAALSIPGEIEPVEISFGRIKRYDTRITGTEALTSLRNRRERIVALAEWMNSREDTPALDNQKAFAQYWKPLILPEMVKKKNRPEHWQQEHDLWVKAEDIRWNTGYTERMFPEMLRPIRNSGTMLRDWEEALEWLYIEYEWERIKESLAKERFYTRIK